MQMFFFVLFQNSYAVSAWTKRSPNTPDKNVLSNNMHLADWKGMTGLLESIDFEKAFYSISTGEEFQAYYSQLILQKAFYSISTGEEFQASTDSFLKTFDSIAHFFWLKCLTHFKWCPTFTILIETRLLHKYEVACKRTVHKTSRTFKED